MSAAILATKTAIEEMEPWQKKAIGVIFAIGFVVGVGITLWIRYTLVVQGIYKTMF